MQESHHQDDSHKLHGTGRDDRNDKYDERRHTEVNRSPSPTSHRHRDDINQDNSHNRSYNDQQRVRSPSPRGQEEPRSGSPIMYQDDDDDFITRDISPGDIPTIPRDQRTPPKILPPRPKHLRSQDDKDVSSSKKSKKKSQGSKSSSSKKSDKHESGGSSSRSRHRDKSQESISAPPPPIISGDTRQSPHSSSSRQQEVGLSIPEGGERDMATSSTSTGISRDWVVFRGPDKEGIPESKHLKRIMIDIVRKLPKNKIKDVPVSRNLGDPLTFRLPRKEKEGTKPLFTRFDYIKANEISEEDLEPVQKVRINIAPVAEYENKLKPAIEGTSGLVARIKSQAKKRQRSLSPRYDRQRSHSPRYDRESSYPLSDDWTVIDDDDEEEVVDDGRGDIRSRLGGRERSPRERRDVRERLGVSVRDRLGDQMRDAETEFSDRGHYRGHRGYRGGRGYHHRGHNRGNRGRGGYRGRGRRSDYVPRRSEDWTHDKYHQDEEPSSTTD